MNKTKRNLFSSIIISGFVLIMLPFLTACSQQTPLPAESTLRAADVLTRRSTSEPPTISPAASPAPTQTQTVISSTLAPSTTPTAWATPLDLSTPTPIPSPTHVYLNSFAVGFSADGSLLAFNSSLEGLVPEDQNHTTDAFIYQTIDGSIQRIPAEKEDPSRHYIPLPAAGLSGDGRYLLYGARSNSPDPAAEHYNTIFLRDLKTGQDERIDFVPLEKQLSAVYGIYPTLSPDGFTLALQVYSSNANIYLLERASGRITQISITPDHQPANGDSYYPTFSPDGRYLAFISTASNLAEGDTPCSETFPNCSDIFLYDIPVKQLTRIPAGITLQMGTPTFRLAVSAGAQWIAWAVEEPETSYRPVIRLYNRQTGKTETICTGDKFCNGHTPSISADGRWLAFVATVPVINAEGVWDPASFAQVYLLDRQTGRITLLSANGSGQPGNDQSGLIQLQSEGFNSDVRISGDGRFVAFSSEAANLLPAGTDKRQCFDPVMIGAYTCYDLFVYDRQTGKLRWISQPPNRSSSKP